MARPSEVCSRRVDGLHAASDKTRGGFGDGGEKSANTCVKAHPVRLFLLLWLLLAALTHCQTGQTPEEEEDAGSPP